MIRGVLEPKRAPFTTKLAPAILRDVSGLAISAEPLPSFPLVAAAGYSTFLVVLAVAPDVSSLLPDRAAHAGAAALQAVLLYWVLAGRFSRFGAAAAAAIAAVAFEGINELLQWFSPPRTAEAEDLFAAVTGVGVAFVGISSVRLLLGSLRASSGIRALEARRVVSTGSSTSVKDADPDPDRCLHCREPIQRGATRCPACLAWQSRWAADSQSPRLEVGLIIVAGALAAAIGAWLFWGGPRQADRVKPRGFEPGVIEVVDAQVVPVNLGGQSGVAVLGSMRSSSPVAWRDPYVQIDMLDHDGRLLETLSARPVGVVVLAFGTAHFRVVESQPVRPTEDYARCRVEVRWATRAE